MKELFSASLLMMHLLIKRIQPALKTNKGRNIINAKEERTLKKKIGI